MAKVLMEKLAPVLRLDSEMDLGTRVKILRMIAQSTAFYENELVVFRRSEKAREKLSTIQC